MAMLLKQFSYSTNHLHNSIAANYPEGSDISSPTEISKNILAQLKQNYYYYYLLLLFSLLLLCVGN